MRKVNLTMKEKNYYQVIKKLVETNAKPATAALKLQLSIRQIYRLVRGYKKEGKAFFSHKNKGKPPVTKISDTLKLEIIELYRTKYFNATYTHFSELLKENENITISSVSLRGILKDAGFSSPRLHKATRKKWEKEFLATLEKPQTKKEKTNTLLKLQHLCDNPHPKREKSKYAGELIQMDASCYAFFKR